jgi:uncharacterized protein (UPF0335 family)
MTRQTSLPPLAGATDAGRDTETGASLAHVHEGEPPGPGHNAHIGDRARDLIRASVQRVMGLRREIAELNADVADTYAALRAEGFDPAMVRRCVNLLEKSPQEREALREKQDLQELYWSCVADMAPPQRTRDEA